MPWIVRVTLPPAGNAATVLETLLPVTVTAPQIAPPVGEPQSAVSPLSAVGTLSLITVALAASGPVLATISV